MKINIQILLLSMLLLSACASQPAYKPASGSGFGYKESQVNDDRYRVHFKARGDKRDEAMDYALLRAAELTLLEGYDWFEVLDRETIRERERTSEVHTGVTYDRVVTRDCGLLSCRSSAQTVPRYHTGVTTGSTGRKETETVLEIRMGKGLRPSTGDSYDAMAVRNRLQDKKNS